MNNLMKEVGCTTKKFHQLVKNKCESMGINSSFRGIVMILGRYGEMSQVELGEKLMLSKPTISITLQKMETQNLIKRTQSKDDARIMVVSLTEDGLLLDQKIKDVFTELEMAISNSLTAVEKEQLIKILNKINQTIESVE